MSFWVPIYTRIVFLLCPRTSHQKQAEARSPEPKKTPQPQRFFSLGFKVLGLDFKVQFFVPKGPCKYVVYYIHRGVGLRVQRGFLNPKR